MTENPIMLRAIDDDDAIDIIDRLAEATSLVRGMGEALEYRSQVEDDDMLHMSARTAGDAADMLDEVSEELKQRFGH